MTRRVRARGIRRSEVDEDQLAVAFLLLSKILHEQAEVNDDAPLRDETVSDGPAKPEAA